MTSLDLAHAGSRHLTPASVGRSRIQRALLLAGLLSSCTYIAADLLAAAQFPGYSLADQAISELSAIGAPTRRFWLLMSVPYSTLLLAFGIGVIRAAGPRDRLNVVGGMLTAFGLSGFLWVFFPMHQRGAAGSWQDVGHMAMSVATVLLLLLYIGLGAFSLGRRFRIYSLTTLAGIVAGSAVTFTWAPRLAAGVETPWLGLVERGLVYAYLLWIAVLSVSLLRESAGAPLQESRG